MGLKRQGLARGGARRACGLLNLASAKMENFSQKSPAGKN
jgi:hypothetical protein